MSVRYIVYECILVLSRVLSLLGCTCDHRHVTPGTKLDHSVYHVIDYDVTQSPTAPRKRKRCCPYKFDSKICREIGDRLLCGYNTNNGIPRDKNSVINLQNGCKIRGGRLECGYVEPPYLNSRRPPGWDYSGQVDDRNDNHISENEISKDDIHKLYNDEDDKLIENKTTRHDGVTRCIEIRDRIVCGIV